MRCYLKKDKLKKLYILIFIICSIFFKPFKSYAEKAICLPPRLDTKDINKINDQDEEEQWKKFDGYLIGNIIINSYKQFDLSKYENKLIRQVFYTLSTLTPNIKANIITSRIPFKENDRMDIRKLKFAKRNLKKIYYIDDVSIKLEENPIDSTYVDIKISFKNKFPIMIDPLGMSFCDSNFFGTGHQLYLEAIPQNNLIDINGYRITYLAPNIHNTKIDFTLDHKITDESRFSKFKLHRPFYRDINIGGGMKYKTGLETIKTIGLKENIEEYKCYYKFNHFKIWGGKNIDIWLDNYNEYYKRLILTVGTDEYRYLEKSENLKIKNITVMNDQTSYGSGICFIKKKIFKIQDSYGRNNRDIIYEGNKLYIYGGILVEENINSRKYFVLDISKGKNIKNIGYFYLNSKIMQTTEGYINKNQKKIIIDPITSINADLGYISPKKKIGIDIRQIITLNYLGRFGDNFKSLASIDGFHYMDIFTKTYSNLIHRIMACTETIFYNPFRIFSVSFDPFIFLEYLFTDSINNSEKSKLIIKNDFSLGGGLLVSAFGFNLKMGISFFPNQPDKNPIYKFILGKSFSLERANIEVSSPTYTNLFNI